MLQEYVPQQAHLSKKSVKGRPVGEDGITLTMMRKDENATYNKQTSNQSVDNNRNKYQR